MSEYNDTKVAQGLGSDAIDTVAARAVQYCDCERQRFEIENEPGEYALRGRLLLQEREDELTKRLCFATLWRKK
jgi:hypothetical protein